MPFCFLAPSPAARSSFPRRGLRPTQRRLFLCARRPADRASARRYQRVLSRAGIGPPRRGCRGGPADGVRRAIRRQGDGRGQRDHADLRRSQHRFLSGSGGNRYGRLAATLETIVAAAKQISPLLATLPAAILEQAVADGMARSLDRFSRYSPPDLARDQRAARNGWGGIGITVDGANDTFRVTAVEPQSPADRAGIRRRTRSSRSTASRRRVRASRGRRPAARPGRHPDLGGRSYRRAWTSRAS